MTPAQANRCNMHTWSMVIKLPRTISTSQGVMVVQGPLPSRHLGPSPIVQIRYVPGMSSFFHASSLSNLRVRSGGNENHVKALRSLYSKERRSVESYHTSLCPYIEVQEKLNDSLDRCHDDDEAELIKKQIAKNALFMVQSFRHNEKGHRYGDEDDCCENMESFKTNVTRHIPPLQMGTLGIPLMT